MPVHAYPCTSYGVANAAILSGTVQAVAAGAVLDGGLPGSHFSPLHRHGHGFQDNVGGCRETRGTNSKDSSIGGPLILGNYHV